MALKMLDKNVKSTKPVKRSWLKHLFITLNYIVATVLTISYLSVYISPATFWPIAFLGLILPYLVITNSLFVIYWLIQWDKLFLLSALLLTLGFPLLSRFFQLNINKGLSEEFIEQNRNSLIKVMSWNVRVFDLYNWTKNKQTRNEMFAFLNEEQPDILCFQEYYNEIKNEKNNKTMNEFITHDSLKTFLKANKFHIYYTLIERNTDKWGIATYTKYPIVNRQEIVFSNSKNNIAIYTDIKIKKDTVRIFNCHLQSAHFSKNDYKFMEDMKNNRETEKLKGGKRIITRLKLAYQKRSVQVDLVRAAIDASPYPVIVCGDFNDTPVSYTYQTIKDNLEDSFMESGNGLGRSYVGNFAPYRIDYILHDARFKARGYTTHPDELSDHYAVSTYLLPAKGKEK